MRRRKFSMLREHGSEVRRNNPCLCLFNHMQTKSVKYSISINSLIKSSSLLTKHSIHMTFTVLSLT